MRSPRIVYSLAAAAAVLAAIPAANAIGDELRAPSDGANVLAQSAVGSAFTYQGRLSDGGTLPTGSYDLRFVLFDDATGGQQIPGTSIITKDDVQVSAGLFTVSLDFGDTAFNGAPRWIELAVKPGSSGQFTILSPRQQVMPVPMAMYAQTAAGLAFPLSSDGSSADGSLVEITQLDAGSVIAATRAYEGATSAPAISGTNAGGGAGVSGNSTNQSGIGISGSSSGLTGIGGLFTGKVGAKVAGLDAQSIALEIDGGVKVSGSNRFAFVHTPAAGNSFHNISWISSPLTDGDPNAVVLVTQVVSATAPPALTPSASPSPSVPAGEGQLTGVGNPHTVAVVYVPASGLDDAGDLPQAAKGKWAIVAADGNEFPDGTSYNVVVIKQ